MIEALFTCPIVLQFAVIVAHDLVDIPGWVHGSQVQAMMGKRKVWLATLANAALPGTAAAFAVWFSGHPRNRRKNTWRCMPELISCSRLVATIRARTHSTLESMPCFLPLSAWR